MEYSSRDHSDETGMTLIELMIVIAIVGLLAAVAIPAFTERFRDAQVQEAVTNIQGILEAEQAYFARFQRYTQPLSWCPIATAGAGLTQNWPEPAALVGGACAPTGPGWAMLGWQPDGPIHFNYRVFSAYDAAGTYTWQPTAGAAWAQSGMPVPVAGFGVNFATEFSALSPQPWCAIEAQGNWDGDADFNYMRTNSYNAKRYRFPNPAVDNDKHY